MATPILSSHAKAAPPSFSYLNMYQIVGSDDTVWQTTITSAANEFMKIYPYSNSCQGRGGYLKYTKDGSDNVKWQYFEVNTSTCKYKAGVDIPAPSNPENSLKLYVWSINEANTIRRFDWGKIYSANFTKMTDPQNSQLQVYTKGGANDCTERLVSTNFGSSADFYAMKKGTAFATYWNAEKKSVDYRTVERTSGAAPTMSCITMLDQENSGTQATVEVTNPNFNINKAKYIEIGHANNGTTVASLGKDQKDSITNSAGITTGGADPAATCEGAIPVLGWVICAVTEAADSIIHFMEGIVKSLLVVTPSMYGESDKISANGINPLKTAWSAIRIISTVILIGIALFMIISQMMGLETMSAYTVKKMVPRLVIAIIAIQLSWVLFTFMIQAVNLIGDGLQTLLYAPFGGAAQIDNITAILHKYYDANPVAGATWQMFTYQGAPVAVFALGVAVMLGAGSAIGLLLGALALSVIVAIAVALFTLVIRLILIISLLVISPLAIVAWIMPGTQSWWSKWWSMFSKLLLMYPLIVLLLSMGKIIAYIIAASGI